jgi:hypothetical protein
MISTVLSGWSDGLNTNTSVKSRRLSSPGNLRLSALNSAPFGRPRSQAMNFCRALLKASRFTQPVAPV